MNKAVCAIIRPDMSHEDDGVVLAVWNRKHQTWGLPGGKVEPGEIPIGALRRELKEETGLTLLRGLQKANGCYTDPIDKITRLVIIIETDVAPGDALAVQGTRWMKYADLCRESLFGPFYTKLIPKLDRAAHPDAETLPDYPVECTHDNPVTLGADHVWCPQCGATTALSAVAARFRIWRVPALRIRSALLDRVNAAELKERVMREHFDTIRKELGLEIGLADVAAVVEVRRLLAQVKRQPAHWLFGAITFDWRSTQNGIECTPAPGLLIRVARSLHATPAWTFRAYDYGAPICVSPTFSAMAQTRITAQRWALDWIAENCP